MENYIELQPLDLTVYGQVQYGFSAADKTGRLTYAEAAVAVAARRAAAVELVVPPIRKGLKQKSEKLEALSNALGEVAKIVVLLKDESMDSTKTIDLPDAAYKALLTYGVGSVSSKSITRKDAYSLQQNIKLELDKEDTQLQETTSALQSFIQKRDSAFGLIGKFQQKIDRTSANTIQAIGGD